MITGIREVDILMLKKKRRERGCPLSLLVL
jgi:hypothetical protein